MLWFFAGKAKKKMKRVFSSLFFSSSENTNRVFAADKQTQTDAPTPVEQETQTNADDAKDAENFLKQFDFNYDPTLSKYLSERLKKHIPGIKEYSSKRTHLRSIVEFVRKTCSLGGTEEEDKLLKEFSKNGVEMDHLHSMDEFDFRVKLKLSIDWATEIDCSYKYAIVDFNTRQPKNTEDLVRNFCWFGPDDDGELKNYVCKTLSDHLISLENIPKITDTEFKEELGITDNRVISKIRRVYANTFLSL